MPTPLASGLRVALPPNAARHVQVLRLQPGSALTLFDGRGGEWAARVASIGRRDVDAEVEAHHAVERESPLAVTLAIGMPANERMDTLVEKATELGVAALQPLVTQRSVLRVDGERAARKAAHWQAIAVAACEQCGRNRVPVVHAPLAWADALRTTPSDGAAWVLGFGADARPALDAATDLSCGAAPAPGLTAFVGPEGGLTDDEVARARARGATLVTLGPRVLRADTAPLALLALVDAVAQRARPGR